MTNGAGSESVSAAEADPDAFQLERLAGGFVDHPRLHGELGLLIGGPQQVPALLVIVASEDDDVGVTSSSRSSPGGVGWVRPGDGVGP